MAKAPTKTSKKHARKTQAPKAGPRWKQPDLFEKAEASAVEIRLHVPQGTTVTIGGPAGVPAQPTATGAACMKIVAALSREELRELLGKCNAQQLINIAAAVHGALYPLAAIGGKVTGRAS